MILKLPNHTTQQLLTLTVLILFTAVPAAAQCAKTSPVSGDPFQMLVLGDSIMWGQGLRPEEKFSTRVSCWLQEKISRPVSVHVEAHSGAVISNVNTPARQFSTTDGEVNQSTPSINEELDHAVEFYRTINSAPALILLNGCINDVGVKTILAASTSLELLRARAQQSCGADMQLLLRRVKTSFPHSQILITSYYPIVSSQTDDNAFLRLLVKKLNSQGPDAHRMSDKEMRQRLVTISEEWYTISTASLLEAIKLTNAAPEFSTTPAVRFVEIQFGPEHMFAAPDTLLWNFMFASTNVSGFAKVVVLLSFGSAAYKANDHVRESRIKSCEQTYKKPKGLKEDKARKQVREDLFLICRYASLGHPNQMGALIYTEAIKGQLLNIIDTAGWKRDNNSHLTLERKDPQQ
jgi:lysophospholipase L1-like esterase